MGIDLEIRETSHTRQRGLYWSPYTFVPSTCGLLRGLEPGRDRVVNSSRVLNFWNSSIFYKFTLLTSFQLHFLGITFF